MYGSGSDFYLKALTDFLGVGYIFFGLQSMYNVTCWYVAELLVIYMMFPLLLKVAGFKLVKSSLLFYVLYLLSRKIPHFIHLYLLCFIIGMLLAKHGVLDKLVNNIYKIKIQIILFFLLFFSVALRLLVGTKADLLLAFTIIGIALVIKINTKNIAIFFRLLGVHSANIFMTHTFFYYYFFTEYIYYPRCPFFVLVFLLINCLVYSLFLELLKDRLTHCFNYIFNRTD